MINQETAEKLGVELELLQSTFEGFKVMSSEDLETLKGNISKSAEESLNAKYKEGVKVGRETLLKEFRDDFGLEVEGSRTKKENIANAITKKFANQSSEEYGERITALTNANDKLKAEFENYREEVKVKENKRVVSDALMKEFSAYAGKTSLSIEDIQTLYSAKNNVVFNGDSIQVFNGEELLKDELSNPVTLQDSIKNFVEGSYLSEKKATGGRGEGDSSGISSETTLEKFAANLEKQGIAKNSMEYNQKISQAVTQGVIKM